MEEKIQARNVKIVLFFSKILENSSVKLANSIMDKISELGEPSIFNIPEEAPNEIKMQMPKIIFDNSKDINVIVTNVNINITINIDNVELIKDKVKQIYDALIENSIKIQAIGIVNQYLYYDINFEKVKEIYYKDDEVKNSDLLNMSWYKKENDINIWKTINIEEKDNIKNMILNMDINNLGNEKDITIKNIEDFINMQYKITSGFVKDLEEKIGGKNEYDDYE